MTTCTVELHPLQVPAPTKAADSAFNTRPESFAGDGQRLVDECATPDAPPGAVSALQQWNNPRGNIFRLSACFWCFLVMGANDAAYGVSTLDRDLQTMLTFSLFFNLYVFQPLSHINTTANQLTSTAHQLL